MKLSPIKTIILGTGIRPSFPAGPSTTGIMLLQVMAPLVVEAIPHLIEAGMRIASEREETRRSTTAHASDAYKADVPVREQQVEASVNREKARLDHQLAVLKASQADAARCELIGQAEVLLHAAIAEPDPVMRLDMLATHERLVAHLVPRPT